MEFLDAPICSLGYRVLVADVETSYLDLCCRRGALLNGNIGRKFA